MTRKTVIPAINEKILVSIHGRNICELTLSPMNRRGGSSPRQDQKNKSMNDLKFNDDSIMPWGKYKGKKMSEVPDHYLLWLHNEGTNDVRVRDYIKENLDAIQINIIHKKK